MKELENIGKLKDDLFEHPLFKSDSPKQAIKHSIISFGLMLSWDNLTDKQKEGIQSNIDYLNTI